MLDLMVCSCTVQNSDLDSGGGPRTHAHSEQLHTTMNPQILWDDYGIIADVEVCSVDMLDIFNINGPIFFSHLQFIFLMQIYTS